MLQYVSLGCSHNMASSVGGGKWSGNAGGSVSFPTQKSGDFSPTGWRAEKSLNGHSPQKSEFLSSFASLGCVTLHQSLTLFEPQWFLLQHEITSIWELLWGLNEIPCTEPIHPGLEVGGHVVSNQSHQLLLPGHYCWRRLLRVPWTARRSSQLILKEIIGKTDTEA